MTKIHFHPTTLFLLALPFLNVLTWGETALLWLSATLHETGHILAYRLCGTGMESVTVLPFGLCAVPQNPLHISPKHEIFCAAAGPATNLLITVCLLALPLPAEDLTVRYLLYCNTTLFLINILPILPLDGGRMLYYTLAQKFPLPVCETVCRRCAVVLLCLLLFPVCVALFLDKNPSLAMIWGYLAAYTVLRRGSI